VDVVVGVGEWAVSASVTDSLVTYSLGSCIGLALYDPVARVGGLLHAQLPLSTLDPSRAATHPGMFTDTGVTALLQGLFDAGAKRQSVIATVAGGGRNMDRSGFFRIGERNYTVLRKLLWKNEILIAAEDVGGEASRTMRLDMASGRTLIRNEGRSQMSGVAEEGGK
jgi:chemotaxis protein CheD